jgi:hypothetical protein
MIENISRSGTWSRGSRPDKASGNARPASCQPETGGSDDFSSRLEQELSLLLSRQRTYAHPAELEQLHHGGNAHLLVSEPPFSEGMDWGDVNDTTARSQEAARRASTLSGNANATRNRWMKTTRRIRRAQVFRKTGSMVISLLVTSFIIVVVAIMLFGLPDSIDKLRAASAAANALIVGDIGEAAHDEPIPIRLQWVPGHLQGR